MPKYIATSAYKGKGTEMGQAIEDLALVAFYYLLRIDEYTT